MSERDGLVRHEEELDVSTRSVEAGEVRARKRVESEPVTRTVDRQIEQVDGLDRVPVTDTDSGEIETLPDGSISIPVLEEELVITKRLVVRERVVIRKRTVTEQQTVEAELRRERVEVEGDITTDRERRDEEEHP